MPPANSPSQDIPPFLLPPTNTSAAGRTHSPLTALFHGHLLPPHPDGLAYREYGLGSTLERLLSESEGNPERRNRTTSAQMAGQSGGGGGGGGLGRDDGQTGASGSGTRGGGGPGPRARESYILEPPQIGSSNWVSMSRTLPPPPRASQEQSIRQTLRDLTGTGSGSSHYTHQQDRQPYGSRPPQFRPGHRQELYDWAPEHPYPSLFDADDFLFGPRTHASSDTGFASSGLLSGPQFFARFAGRHRELRDEANSTNSSDSPNSATAPYPTMTGTYAELNDGRTQPSFHLSSDSPFRNAVWMSDHYRRQQQRELSRRTVGSLRDDLVEYLPPRNAGHRARSYGRLARAGSRRLPNRRPVENPEMQDLADIITYLAKLRSSRSLADSTRMMEKHIPHYLPKTTKVDPDFMIDTRSLRVPECCFLQPGAIFHGSQTTEPRKIAPFITTTSTIRPSTMSSISSGNTANVANTNNGAVNDWKVKVNITSVDYSNMRLTGTMEAFGDWNWPSGEKKRSISTYLDGEIIDFKTHTLETFSFDCETLVDANYWSKLEPFSSLANHEDRRKAFLSKKWIKQEVLDKYILMRWKEKCFINTDAEGSEESILTIRGFYFLSLKRSTGAVMGLYYDPESPPLQELLLEPVGCLSFPKFEMR